MSYGLHEPIANSRMARRWERVRKQLNVGYWAEDLLGPVCGQVLICKLLREQPWPITSPRFLLGPLH